MKKLDPEREALLAAAYVLFVSVGDSIKKDSSLAEAVRIWIDALARLSAADSKERERINVT